MSWKAYSTIVIAIIIIIIVMCRASLVFAEQAVLSHSYKATCCDAALQHVLHPVNDQRECYGHKNP